MRNSLRPGRRPLLALAFALAATSLAGGCGGPPRAKLQGTVTMDGVPLPDGSIEFFPSQGVGQTAGTSIKDGKYAVEASVGPMKVAINAMVVTGRQKAYDTPDSPMMDIVKSAVPERYNTKSELTATLTAGPNVVDFDLTSDKKK